MQCFNGSNVIIKERTILLDERKKFTCHESWGSSQLSEQAMWLAEVKTVTIFYLLWLQKQNLLLLVNIKTRESQMEQ